MFTAKVPVVVPNPWGGRLERFVHRGSEASDDTTLFVVLQKGPWQRSSPNYNITPSSGSRPRASRAACTSVTNFVN